MYNSNNPIMKITLKEKKLADGKISLYIESFKGSTVDEKTGKRVHLRDFEFLKLYLHPNPKTASEKKDNKEALQLAEDILALRKSEFLQGRYGDRKSTRLNSSHVKISYAVFCLKKKIYKTYYIDVCSL